MLEVIFTILKDRGLTGLKLTIDHTHKHIKIIYLN